MTRPSDEWLLARRTGLGGTDLAAIFGHHPYVGGVEVYLDKVATGPPQRRDLGEKAYWGLALEQIVGEEYARRTPGTTVEDVPRYQTPLERCGPIVFASRDLDVHCERRGLGCLEVKTTGMHNAQQWDEGIPMYVAIQLQAQLAVTGRKWGAIALLVGGQVFQCFDVARNDTLIDAMIPAAERWWDRHVVKEVPPNPGSKTAVAIRDHFAEAVNGKVEELPGETDDFLLVIEAAKGKMDKVQAIKKEAENEIRLAMGDAEYGVTPDGRWVSWRNTDRKGYTVEAKSHRELRVLKRRPKGVKHGGEK